MDPQQCGCRGSTPFVIQTSEREVIEGHRQCGLIDDGLQLDCGGRPGGPRAFQGSLPPEPTAPKRTRVIDLYRHSGSPDRRTATVEG